MSIGGYRGINNRNPLNVKIVSNGPWSGETGQDDTGHAIFADPVYSVRACVRTLANYVLKHKRNTLRLIYAMYAPTNDNNNPDEYALFVSERTEIPVDLILSIFLEDGSVVQWGILESILRAMCEMENYSGYELPTETLASGIAMYQHDFVK